jgi:hypothetical protein
MDNDPVARGPYELELMTAVGPNDLWVTSRQTLHHWNKRELAAGGLN